LGIALFGSLAGGVYRSGTARTSTNTKTIGDALVQAAGLSPAEAADLIQAAQTAFVHGFRIVTILGAALLLIAAIATPPLLGQQPRVREAQNALQD
jgi:MFS transporter, DHA2 family, multidrug resistance protein